MPVIKSDMRRNTRPDMGWLAKFAAELEANEEVAPRLRLWNSGLLFEANGRLEVADPLRSYYRAAPSGFDVVPIQTAFNKSDAILLAIASCKPGTVARDLAIIVAMHCGEDYDNAFAFIHQLIMLGVFTTELRLPLVGDPTVKLLEILERIAPESAVQYEQLLRAYEDSDATQLPDAVSILYDRAMPIAKALSTSDSYWQIDTSRTLKGAISDSVIRQIKNVLEKLAYISPLRRPNQALAEAFNARFNEGREQPLLQLLDPASGIDFDEISEEDEHNTAGNYVRLQIALEALVDRCDTVILDDTKLETLKVVRPKAYYPKSLETICNVGYSESTPRLLMMSLASASNGKSLQRFHHLLDATHFNQQGDVGSTIIAELAIMPHERRSANLAVRAPHDNYEIVCGVMPSVSDERTIRLDDLVVGVANGRAYVRSLRLNKVLDVRQSHMLNLRRVSRIARFFSALASTDQPHLFFSWGPLAGALPVTPRLTIDGTIISPKTWRLPKAHALSFGETLSQEWRDRYRLPDVLYLVENDNRLLLDFRHEICQAYLKRVAKKLADDGSVELQEPVPSFADGLHSSFTSFSYLAELAVTVNCFYDEHTDPEITWSPEYSLIAEHALQPMGSRWVYVKLYISFERMSYFIETVVRQLASEMNDLVDGWHFLRYKDPDPHVRVRFHAKNTTVVDQLISKVVALTRTLVDENICSRLLFDIYDREIERYGGLKCIEHIESIFSFDSSIVADRMSAMRVLADQADTLADIAAFSIALFGDSAESIIFFRRIFKRRRKFDIETWDRIKGARLLLRESSTRYAQLRSEVQKVQASLTVERCEGVFRALLHMHCNRLGVGASEEHSILEQTWAALEGQVVLEQLTAAGGIPSE